MSNEVNESTEAKVIKIFSPERVEELNKYQQEGKFHPYTCPNDGDRNHIIGEFKSRLPENIREDIERLDTVDALYESYIAQEKVKGIPYPEQEFKQTKLIATEEGWICPFCDYKQTWTH